MSRNSSPRTPCFLLSSARGGSTLVTRLLNSHSQVASPCEICVPFVVRTSWKFVKSLRSMRKIGRYYGRSVPPAPLHLALRGPARRDMNGLTRAILRKESKQILVIKDPRHASYVGQIERLYHDAQPKYILLYRDARAVAHSFHRNLKRTLDRGFRVWQEAVEGMQACAAAFPERCLTVRFEDILRTPGAAMARVVEFLGHQYEPEMLNYARHVHADDALNLWQNQRLIASVRSGLIRQTDLPAWHEDADLIQEYRARSAVVALNESLGYDLTRAA